MEEVVKFLKDSSVFYFATVDGDKPKVRPFGFSMEFENKLYFGIGKHKQSYNQILNNSNVEISTVDNKGQWIRICGQVALDDRVETLDAAFTQMPDLKKMYNDETKLELGLIYLNNATAEIANFTGGFKQISL